MAYVPLLAVQSPVTFTVRAEIVPGLNACVGWQEEVLGMEGGLAEAQAAFAMLDAQMSRESQTAAKIGDRLHVSALPRSTAVCPA